MWNICLVIRCKYLQNARYAEGQDYDFQKNYTDLFANCYSELYNDSLKKRMRPRTRHEDKI